MHLKKSADSLIFHYLGVISLSFPAVCCSLFEKVGRILQKLFIESFLKKMKLQIQTLTGQSKEVELDCKGTILDLKVCSGRDFFKGVCCNSKMKFCHKKQYINQCITEISWQIYRSN